MKDKTPSLEDARREATVLLQRVSATATLDASLLLQKATGLDRVGLIVHAHKRLLPEQAKRLQSYLERRLAGEPIAYILGEKEFWSMNFRVTRDTLIPRPETELLVEVALSLAAPNQTVLDLGTGSGAIAVALAHERPDLRVVATDISAQALAVAKANGERHGVQVEWLQSDWGKNLAKRRFDLVVSNPPYIAEDDPHLKGDGLRFEPKQALVSAEEGFSDIRKIVEYASNALNPGGWLALEHGCAQGQGVVDLMAREGFVECRTIADGEKRPRVSVARKRTSQP